MPGQCTILNNVVWYEFLNVNTDADELMSRYTYFGIFDCGTLIVHRRIHCIQDLEGFRRASRSTYICWHFLHCSSVGSTYPSFSEQNYPPVG